MGGLEHANSFIRVLFSSMCIIIVVSVLLAQRGREMFIRRIPGLTAIEEAVGRATEMGRPIFFSPGLAGIGITTLQALAILAHIVRLAAARATRIITAINVSSVYPIAEETVREAYDSVGRSADYRPDDVRFVSEEQFAYALGSIGIMAREQTATNFLFGQFYAEALILTENGRALGSLQVAGCPDPVQIPFFIATCDYVVIGDEFYAASAYLTREPTLMGSLVGQDIVKALLLLLIIAGLVIVTLFPGHPGPTGLIRPDFLSALLGKG
ncbi:MAG: hypothetical protein MUQ26_01420 [Armatimonadetes bacterium]|nr:hypothetical protein [Armatimonadota bacterium]